MNLRLIECPPFTSPTPSYKPGDCWYAREGDAWRCKTCDCVWRKNPDETWSLYDGDETPGECCDNVPMDLERVYWWWSNHYRTVKPPSSPHADIAPEYADRRPMIVVLPTGVTHCLHSPFYRDGKKGNSGWKVEGILPNVTVHPSINYGTADSEFHWHGHIKNGVMA